ncbi:Aspartyl-tRNA(Asn) amidotransferase subunit A / Glutamyl-tRNA(Gln) amidotransferase subunit A [Rubellimicrobium mesophilum DSM 19309]|uniref:Aspartyl-tRNA(Asn) amidotransferase subunit A / Glutamyl-tRNA(Gln) amidotransferase subunit A n=1 Tax=Rubellimicrobium mesophilum DSM 19309 TaxID=442562 RepID=A0A017HRS6_9RHOB|nr:amidase [Rubellimicrobium mesophilum]EYD77202.1 Aspartyl-tRNA(Asn) amidotransferase subunit A / Glutamyl-tRNA(Gln) amidotransferase subunit A [Rubellimicrobium mesophilum DSM 19309]
MSSLPLRSMSTASPVPSVAEAGEALRSGRLAAVDLLRLHRDRIAAVDGQVRAFWAEDPRAERLAARADEELAAGHDRGPLHGIPFVVKDMVDVEGLPTTNGSRAMDRVPAARDAEAVRRLIEAGAVPLGKVATYEWGFVGPEQGLEFPPAANPWNTAHITGGSSSGSAAAVAAGMARLAVGSDTGGSIRSPSAYCGVVGLKPTRGRVPGEGFFTLSPKLDHPGPLAATVAEAALMLDVMAPGAGAASRIGAGAGGLTLGYARDWFARDPALDPRVLAAMDEAASALSLAGARIVEVQMPGYDLLEAVGAVMIHAEGLRLHERSLREWGDLWGRMATQTVQAGVVLTDEDLARAEALVPRLSAEVDRVLDGCDAILTATTLSPAPPFAAFDKGAVWTPMRTLPFNVTGHPAMSAPAGFAGGLPVGLQVVGRHGDEGMVCRVGAAFEAATDHGAQRPVL